jgi:hypothetical protein
MLDPEIHALAVRAYETRKASDKEAFTRRLSVGKNNSDLVFLALARSSTLASSCRPLWMVLKPAPISETPCQEPFRCP